jgi:hypothetical protein
MAMSPIGTLRRLNMIGKYALGGFGKPDLSVRKRKDPQADQGQTMALVRSGKTAELLSTSELLPAGTLALAGT